ncbi:MAG: sugar ABC transporter substrate-binding protein [Chloroflexi bacterium]|nr:MAG: sugar ABC transporter substrate-binding protein [Chloroflexota bacterium]
MAACGGSSAPAAPASSSGGDSGSKAEQPKAEAPAEAVTLQYSLWDANQLPAYQTCADNFTAQNPNIKIEISQLGWGDYWNNLQTSMVAGNAPDVFTNHLAKYPEFVANNQLVDIQPMVDKDNVDLGIYMGDLADLWTKDGKRYGLPKDWDTIAVIYNKEMLDAAGVTVDELNAATWNPQDGGTFEEIAAKLTLDANGNNGLSPDFDKSNVTQYGYVPFAYQDTGGAYGQTQWSHFAVSNGWKFNDGLYDTKYYYDDPKFIETIDWMQGIVIDKGYSPAFEQVASLGGNALFTSGKVALTTDGSWMIGTYSGNSDFEVGFARLPQGPEGRKSMFNGLADSIWAGSKHQAEAWEWVKYLASPECANVVGDAGVVFPAQEQAVERALKAYQGRGLDVSAFTQQALEKDGTFLFPVTDNASEITDIMTEALDSIFLGQVEPAEALPAANEKVNATFK